MRLFCQHLARLALVAALAFGAAAQVQAQDGAARRPVVLLPDPVSHGGRVVLGDLFSGLTPAEAGTLVASGAEEGRSLVLSSAQVQALAARVGLEWKNETGLRRVIVVGEAAAKAEGRGRATVAAPRQRQVLVYARNIPTGDVIAAEDLVFGDPPPEAFLSQPLNDPDAAAGRIARHALRAGSPVIARDLVMAKVIHRDDVVVVTFADDGMMLSLQGKALNEAAVGDVVQVVNPMSKKIVEAVASAPGHALIGPAAEELRQSAAGSTPVNRYASTR